MGRASNHKKMRRRAALTPRPAAPRFQAEGRRQLRHLVAELAQTRFHLEREERYADACRAWCGGTEPVLAPAPRWVHGTSGRQLAAGSFLAEAQDAPCLATAVVPPAAVLADDPAQWHVAANALIRAVAFDGLEAGHPAVNALLDALAPVAEAELNHWPDVWAWLSSEERQRTQPAPGFPVLDGPVAVLGSFLGDAAQAAVGSTPDTEEIAVLSRALEGTIPGVAGSVVADALTQDIYPLQALAASGAFQPAQALRVGLAVLTALLRLFQTEATVRTSRVA
jgi:hypothetical protein